MADVFISYCSADRARAGEIAHGLEREGLSVWWDRALIVGESYEAEIDKALVEARSVIVVWSQAAAASEWVRSEADSARQKGNLAPVVIEPCRIPRPFDRLHTIDLSKWKGDRGNDGFPELVEAAKAIAEGRAARRVPWKRRLTIAAIGSSVMAGLLVISALTGIADAMLRWSSAGAFAAIESGRLVGKEVAPETQEGFRTALAELARSSDLRTQRALALLERSGSRGDALVALQSLASDQGAAIDGQMKRTASLWRQIGLLRFNEEPQSAREALEQSRRYDPDDPITLTALGSLYQREGRIAEADEAYRIVLSRGALDASLEGRVRQVLGQAHLERGEVIGAEREFRRAFELAEASDDDALIANLYIDLGLVEIERGHFQAARDRFTEGRDFALSLGYADTVAYADYNAAEALIAEGKFDLADSALRSAAQTARDVSDKYLGLYIDLAAARIAMLRREPQRALDIARDVRVRAAGAGVRRAELEASVRIAEAQLALGRDADALETIGVAVKGWRDMRATGALAAAESMRAIIESRNPAQADQACAKLRSDSSTDGYAKRELTRLLQYAACPG